MLQARDVVPANTLRRAHDRGLGLGSGEDPLLVHHRDEGGQSSAAHVRADEDALVQNNTIEADVHTHLDGSCP